jgi:hypothetical protein
MTPGETREQAGDTSSEGKPRGCVVAMVIAGICVLLVVAFLVICAVVGPSLGKHFHPLDRFESVDVPLDVKDASVERYVYAAQRYVRGFRDNAQFTSGRVRTDAELRPLRYDLSFRVPYEDKDRPHGHIFADIDLYENTLDYIIFSYDYEEDKIGETSPLSPEDFADLLEQALAVAKNVQAREFEQDIFCTEYELIISLDGIVIDGRRTVLTDGEERMVFEDSYFRVKDGIVIDPESGGMTWEQFRDSDAE